MDKNQRALLELLKEALFGQKAQLPEDLDWAAVLEEARAQTVAALTAKAVPAEQQKSWQEDILQTQAIFIRVLHGQTQLVKTFEEAGVPLVILKGAAAAVYYPDPAGVRWETWTSWCRRTDMKTPCGMPCCMPCWIPCCIPCCMPSCMPSTRLASSVSFMISSSA